MSFENINQVHILILIKFSLLLGHEATGTVVKCGPDAKIAIGSRVAVENHFYCGDCYTCKVNIIILLQTHVHTLKLLFNLKGKEG